MLLLSFPLESHKPEIIMGCHCTQLRLNYVSNFHWKVILWRKSLLKEKWGSERRGGGGGGGGGGWGWGKEGIVIWYVYSLWQIYVFFKWNVSLKNYIINLKKKHNKEIVSSI